MHGETVKLE